MAQIILGDQRIKLEEPISVSLHDNSSRILQRDYLNAIMQVRVEKEVREALNQVDVREGEAHLDTWVVTGKGVYVGSWSKRLAKYLYKEHQVKLNPQTISVITERVSRTMAGSHEDLMFVFSREPWEAGEFGEKSDSCWFGSRSFAHCQRGLFKDPKGGAVKFYTPGGRKRARCWYYNLEGSLLIFNAYDRDAQLDVLSMARIISVHYGMEYYKHPEVNLDTAYVNGKSIYSIGNPPISRPITLDFALREKKKLTLMDEEPRLYVPSNLQCPNCGSSSGSPEITVSGKRACSDCVIKCISCRKNITYNECVYIHDGSIACNACAEEHYVHCDVCDNLIPRDRANDCPRCNEESFVCANCEESCNGEQYNDHNGDTICESCRDEYYITCDDCGEMWHTDDSYYIDGSDRWVCKGCYDNNYYRCASCNEIIHSDDVVEIRGDVYCEACGNERSFTCDRCGGTEHTDYQFLVYTTDDEENEESWCEECHDAHATTCSNCSMTYSSAVNHDCTEDDDDED